MHMWKTDTVIHAEIPKLWKPVTIQHKLVTQNVTKSEEDFNCAKTLLNVTQKAKASIRILLIPYLKWVARYGISLHWVTSMLVTDVGDQMCWWQVWDVGDRFRMFVIDLIHNEKTNITKKVANIMILPPTSENSHHHKVINITMSPTSLPPNDLVTTLRY